MFTALEFTSCECSLFLNPGKTMLPLEQYKSFLNNQDKFYFTTGVNNIYLGKDLQKGQFYPIMFLLLLDIVFESAK